MFSALKKAIGFGQLILSLILFAFVVQTGFARQLADRAAYSLEIIRLQCKGNICPFENIASEKND
jgi:hypothetical protein